MPIDEAIERLQNIRRQHAADDVQLWIENADGEEMRVTDFEVIVGAYIIQVNVN